MLHTIHSYHTILHTIININHIFVSKNSFQVASYSTIYIKYLLWSHKFKTAKTVQIKTDTLYNISHGIDVYL